MSVIKKAGTLYVQLGFNFSSSLSCTVLIHFIIVTANINSNLLNAYPDKLIIVKFKNGHVITVSELKEDELIQRSSDNEYISADVPVKRYGRFLMCYVYKDDDYCCKYKFIDSRSHKTIMDYEIPENQIHGKVDLNWNEREFSYTYYEEGFHFKISRIKSRIDQRTLKHFARLAVLTSFSEEYLIQQNLPSTLFDNLGIDK